MAEGGDDGLLEELAQLVDSASGSRLEVALERVMARLGCRVGTIHLIEESSGMLVLHAHRGVPPPVLEKIGRIPIGKGMAGLAAERREPVQLCNLQEDDAVVRPDAKRTGAEGSIACPMLAIGPDGEPDGRLLGVLGVAKVVPHDYSAAEISLLMDVGRCLA